LSVLVFGVDPRRLVVVELQPRFGTTEGFFASFAMSA